MKKVRPFKALFCLVLLAGLTLGAWSVLHADPDYVEVKICRQPGFLSEICTFNEWEVTITWVCDGSVCSTQSQIGCAPTCQKSAPLCTSQSSACGPVPQ